MERGQIGSLQKCNLQILKNEGWNTANMSTKHLKIRSQRQTVEIHFVFLPFPPSSVEDSVQTLITRRTDTLAVSTEYKAEAGLKKELSLLFQSTPL